MRAKSAMRGVAPRRVFTTPAPYRCHAQAPRSQFDVDPMHGVRTMRRLRLALLALAALLVAAAAPAHAKVIIEIDKSTQRMTVSVDGATRWIWPVSTGRRGHATPNGTHQAFRMEEDHYSKEWDDAPMPHSIFFTKRGHAIHGSYDIKRLGTAASAGCVRLHPDNARQLFALVREHGVLNTTVIISGEEPPAAPPPAIARQQQQQQQQQSRAGAAAAARRAAGAALRGLLRIRV